MSQRDLVIGILVILLFSSLAMGTEGAIAHKNAVNKGLMTGQYGQSVEINGVRYTTHAVIRINNNTDFANQAAAESWPGNGTQGNPYVISGYDMDAHGAGNAIYIGNTTVYFIVENSYLHNTSYHSWPYFYGAGITFYNVSHGILENNTCNNNDLGGLYLSSSGNNVVENNTCSNNGGDGIDLVFSSNNVVENNTCSNNGGDGIYLNSSSNNTLKNNTCDNNVVGIVLESSTNNRLYSNKLVNGGIYLGEDENVFTTQDIPTNNTVNGKPVYYYKNINMDNASIPLYVGQVILGNVSWLKVGNLNIHNASLAIEIGYSTHITVRNNTCSDNSEDGIDLYSSSNNTLENNTCSNNWDEGIDLYSSSNNNVVENNTCSNNRAYGILLYSSSNNNVVENNTCSNNNEGGITLYSSSNNTLENNTCSNNSGDGIYLYYSSNNNVIADNLISHNADYGVCIGWSADENLIYNNSFYYNDGSGDIYNSSHVQAYDDGSNWWNTTGSTDKHGYGNYWYGWANNNNSNDKNRDGIVDWPYMIGGYSDAFDQYPLKNATYSMPLLAPTSPQNLWAKSGDKYVNLTWEKPLGEGSSPITEYKIYRNNVLIAIVPANQHYYNDTSVVNGQTYTYYVTAVNSVGESEKSNEVQATPGQDVPEFSAMLWLGIIVMLGMLAVARRKFS